ncbi:MAG: VacJ family lipoprotein, partial [Alphaproteobacteria bacterium]
IVPAAASEATSAAAPEAASPSASPTGALSPPPKAAPAVSSENDPFEKTNRKIFAFNQSLDKHIMRPVAVFYRDTLPDPMRDGVHSFLANLDMLVTVANDILQARPRHLIQAVGRVTVNSTLGIGGLVDVATKFGIPDETADFGQTLGIYGVKEGPYLIIPFVGPKPPRDLAGGIVDLFFDPVAYIRLREKGLWQGGRTALSLLDERSRQLDTVDKLQASSIDFYATVRNLYRQDRNAKINGKGSLENLPDF